MHLLMKNIHKSFFGAPVLSGVDFSINSGEIHSLLGENGAGKTTLMNILYGLYNKEAGEITINGKSAEIRNPIDALSLGIGMVHQHFQLVDTLTVSENITLGLREKGYPFPDRKGIDDKIHALSRQFGLDVAPEKKILGLSVGERQRVEIMKLLYRSAKILIFDEPTAVLTPPEIISFFEVLKELRKADKGIVIITHKISEVQMISDRVTVLRDGKCVLQCPIDDTDELALSTAMIGRMLQNPQHKKRLFDSSIPRLELSGATIGTKKLNVLDHFDLTIAPGEIVGIAGVDGNGQQELAEAVLGLQKLTSGNIYLDGKEIQKSSIIQRIQSGIGYIPADRHQDALLLSMDLEQNLLLKKHKDDQYLNHGFIDSGKIATTTKRLIQEFEVKMPSENVPVRYLSGGNQQKFVLAREFDSNLRLLVACQPTRGLDIGATEFIQKQLLELADRGVSILLISTDLQEIISLSDRISVLFRGQNIGIINNDETMKIDVLGALMGGKRFEDLDA